MAKNNKTQIKDSLMNKVANYDAGAFEELYRLSSSAVYAYALSILRSKEDAEEVMQEVFVAAYENIDSYNYQGKAMAWIITITRNQALMKIRDNKKRSHQEFETVDDYLDKVDIEKSVTDQILLANSLNALEENEREIVILHSVANLKHREIAELYDMPLSTVLSKYKRTLSKLRKRMEEIGYERA